MNDAFDRLTAALADRYRIERELGQGGMATEFAAESRPQGLPRVRVGLTRSQESLGRGSAAVTEVTSWPGGGHRALVLPLFPKRRSRSSDLSRAVASATSNG